MKFDAAKRLLIDDKFVGRDIWDDTNKYIFKVSNTAVSIKGKPIIIYFARPFIAIMTKEGPILWEPTEEELNADDWDEVSFKC